MGGFRSGRTAGSGRATTGEQRRLDVRWLHRQGYLQPGMVLSLSWTHRDQPHGDIQAAVSAHGQRLTLLYQFRERGGAWQTVEQAIPLTFTACNFGGRRAWFVCRAVKDGAPCGRRVALLYGAGRLFGCRHCWELCYGSQYEDPEARLWRKMQSIRRRCGQEGGDAYDQPRKPPRMWWRTYGRLRDEWQAAFFEREDILGAQFARLMAHHEKQLGPAQD